MTKRIASKHKIDRRLGVNLWDSNKSPYAKGKNYGPGIHGQKPKKFSDYGIQLRAKQKLKGYYGNISEKQFYGYYVEASRKRGDTGENLIGLLERRLDCIIYRLKFAPTVFSARQIINHGHVLVNGKRVNIPSYLVRAGDEISIDTGSKQMALILGAVQSQERNVPDYLEQDAAKLSGKVGRIPSIDDVPYPVKMEPNLVIEFYSR